jgi:hypothetical protein
MPGDWLELYGMQEARGSSPLSSTQIRQYISNKEPVILPNLRGDSRGNPGPGTNSLTSRSLTTARITVAVHRLRGAQEVISLLGEAICHYRRCDEGEPVGIRCSFMPNSVKGHQDLAAVVKQRRLRYKYSCAGQPNHSPWVISARNIESGARPAKSHLISSSRCTARRCPATDPSHWPLSLRGACSPGRRCQGIPGLNASRVIVKESRLRIWASDREAGRRCVGVVVRSGGAFARFTLSVRVGRVGRSPRRWRACRGRTQRRCPGRASPASPRAPHLKGLPGSL